MTDKHDVMPCPDGDLCPDARRYGKIHPKPDDPKTTVGSIVFGPKLEKIADAALRRSLKPIPSTTDSPGWRVVKRWCDAYKDDSTITRLLVRSDPILHFLAARIDEAVAAKHDLE